MLIKSIATKNIEQRLKDNIACTSTCILYKIVLLKVDNSNTSKNERLVCIDETKLFYTYVNDGYTIDDYIYRIDDEALQ